LRRQKKTKIHPGFLASPPKTQPEKEATTVQGDQVRFEIRLATQGKKNRRHHQKKKDGAPNGTSVSNTPKEDLGKVQKKKKPKNVWENEFEEKKKDEGGERAFPKGNRKPERPERYVRGCSKNGERGGKKNKEGKHLPRYNSC